MGIHESIKLRESSGTASASADLISGVIGTGEQGKEKEV